MGLDMYAFVSTQKPPAEFGFKVDEAVEIHYWRKHPNLHGWMEQLYRAKGGAKPDFNSVPLQLTAEDIDALELAIRAGALPQTSGFFFGTSDGSETEDDLTFVAKAREALSTGHTVIYDSWW